MHHIPLTADNWVKLLILVLMGVGIWFFARRGNAPALSPGPTEPSEPSEPVQCAVSPTEIAHLTHEYQLLSQRLAVTDARLAQVINQPSTPIGPALILNEHPRTPELIRREVFRRTDDGEEIHTIAARLGISRSEVELLLHLRRQ